MIFNFLDNTTEFWMTKYIIREFFISGRETLYKNPSDQTVYLCTVHHTKNPEYDKIFTKFYKITFHLPHMILKNVTFQDICTQTINIPINKNYGKFIKI